MAIRNVMTFKRQPVQNVTINRYINVQQPTVKQNSGMGLAWAFFGLNAATTLFNGIFDIFGSGKAAGTLPAKQEPPKDDTEFNNLKKVGKDFGYEVIKNSDGNFTAYKPGEGLPITGDYKYVLEILLKNKKDTIDSDSDSDIDTDIDTDSDMDTDTDPEVKVKGDLKEYGIDPAYGNKTLDIKNGYTWFNIVSAKYDIPDGVSAKDVALALAAANSGAEGADAMKLAREGVFFKVGDVVTLPNDLTVNGQKISLKGDHENQAVTPDNYSFVKASHWSAKVTQVGDKWFVTENGTRIGEAFDSKAEAEAERDRLNAAQYEE